MATAQIHITLKPTLLDTQGATVLKALHQLGHAGVRDVRIGKLIEVQLDDSIPGSQQQAQLETMCKQLLANPVVEDYEIILNDGTAATTPVVTAPLETSVLTTTTTPVLNTAPLGSEPTTIADPFAISYDTYSAMTAEERLDVQGRAWNLHQALVTNALNENRAAWVLVVGNRVLESGSTLDTYPSEAHLTAVGTQHGLVPFVFTRPPQ